MHAPVDLTVSSTLLVPRCCPLGRVVVVVAGCVVTAGLGRHKLAMNSASELTGDVVGVCASGCPCCVDGPLSSRDCIGRTRLVVSPSCHCSPLSVISGA
ncbi:unnamed protein product [Lactuca virosa]|uniref:Secreted protein n=1 Tax=Lactuca virosa TaxID=75947 RepID=A0AAU9LFX5_9ASTR|nr:unnamed protein product [Lactuca virosa]